MPTRQTITSLFHRNFHRAALTVPLTAIFLSLLALPAGVSAAPQAGQPSTIALEQRLATLEAIVQKQQALIASQATQITSLQSRLQNVVTRDAAGNVVVPGSLVVGRTAAVGYDLQVARNLAVEGHVLVGYDLAVDRNLVVGRDLAVQNKVTGSTADFSTVKANLADFDVLSVARGKFRFPNAP